MFGKYEHAFGTLLYVQMYYTVFIQSICSMNKTKY